MHERLSDVAAIVSIWHEDAERTVSYSRAPIPRLFLGWAANGRGGDRHMDRVGQNLRERTSMMDWVRQVGPMGRAEGSPRRRRHRDGGPGPSSSSHRRRARRARRRRVQISERSAPEWNGITKDAILKPDAQGCQKADVSPQQR